MNPGPVEEVGQTARSFMDVMKSQPLALALAIMNLALLGIFWYVTKEVASRRAHEFDQMMQQQEKIQILLSKCIVPAGNFKLQSDELKPYKPEDPK